MEKIYTRDDECPFVKGDEILVENTHPRARQVPSIAKSPATTKYFYLFDQTLSYPFICLDIEGRTVSYRYAKKIQPDLEVDAKVWVDGNDTPRHFSHFNGDKLYYFLNGLTSHTANGMRNTVTGEARIYALTDPNKHDCCKG